MHLPTLATLIAATTLAIVVGSLLDRAIGDPRPMPHLVRGIGRLVAAGERWLRRPPSGSGAIGDPGRADRRRGTILVVAVIVGVALVCVVVIGSAYAISVWVGLVVEAIICFQCLAVKSLRDESSAVQASLEAGDLAQARRDVSMIVGRDTDRLDESGVARAGVETVAENTADGVVAPMMAMFVAGSAGAVIYKAINTMDSMIGYRNVRYVNFGRTAARLDDGVNWVPARVAATLMVLAAALTGRDWRGTWRVWRRDHGLHASPNSAHTESACAGALGIELGGPSTYAGEPHDKPIIGAPGRSVTPADITSANQLMSATAWLTLLVVVALRTTIWVVILHA